MEDFARAVANFVRDHEAWAAPIVLVLAFGESLAFISLLAPAWGALVAIGALIGVTGISFYPVWIAGAVGAAPHQRGRTAERPSTASSSREPTVTVPETGSMSST